MKSELQIQHLLNRYSFKSELDRRIILTFCTFDLKLNLETDIELSPDGLTVASFTEWYEKGTGCGEILKWNDKVIITGECELDSVKIAGILNGDRIEEGNVESSAENLQPASEEERKRFLHVLSLNKLQLDEQTLALADKYIPDVNERVIFHNDKVRGLGVIRDVDSETGEVELYCYSIYQTGCIGYSMHEKGICNLHDYYFEPMTESELKKTKLNAASCIRRLNRELEKYGKVWKDKLHRIEPLQVMAETGEKYWYIDDKMKAVKTVEKGTPTSRHRYQAGNYFTSFEDCTNCLKKFTDVLKDNLAKPETPPNARK
jgi:hypothetical protein